MAKATVIIEVDTIELDKAIKKAVLLSELMDKVQEQINLISGNKPVSMNCQVVSAIDPERIKKIIKDHDLNCHLIKFKDLITKSTSR